MPLTTAILYTRVSTDEQARDGLSLEAQLADCRQYAQRREWVIGEEYVDVMSGKRDDRPQYQRLLTEVRSGRERGQAIVVVVAALDRFGRRLMERVRAREELKTLGVAVHSVRDGGEVSDLVANILASVAQEEVRRLGERVSASRNYVRERGWMPVGRVAWGYRWRDATPEERARAAPKRVREVEPAEAACVIEAFERIARGESLRSVVKWVETLSYEQRGGRNLRYTTIRTMLRSPWYIQGQGLDSGGLINDDLWGRAQARLNDRRFAMQASGRYLLTGILRCPRCGGKVGGHRYNTKLNASYVCQTGIKSPGPACGWQCVAHPLDTLVCAEVGAWLSVADNPAQLAILRTEWQAYQRASARPDAHGVQLRQVHREVERERSTLIALTRQYATGEIDQLSYQLTRDETLVRLHAAEGAVVTLDEPGPTATIPEWGVVASLLRTAGATLKMGGVSKQRRVLVELIDHGVGHIVSWRKYRVDLTPTPLGQWLREKGLSVPV